MRFQTPNDNDVTLAELQRLLQIQPRNRALAAELIDLKGDKERDAFVKRLREGSQHEGLLRDVLHFLKLDQAQREELRPLVATDPAKVVTRLLEIVKKDPEQRKADVELLKKQPERNLIREHALDQDRRDRFDVAVRLPGVKASGSEEQKHYELHLFVTATDNNLETGPGKAPPKGPFVFLVVSQNELIAEIIKQERKLYNLLKESVDNLEARQTTLNAELLRLDSPQPELSLVAARADLARKAVRETGDIARAVLEKYRLIVTELEVNRVTGDKIKKLQERVVTPLDDLTDKNRGYIPVVAKTANEFWNGLETDIAKKKKADDAKKVDEALLKELEERRQLHKLEGERTSQQIGGAIKQLRTVLEAMQDTIEADKLVELLVRIEADHREAERQLRMEYIRIRDILLGDAFDDLPAGKGQKK